MHRTLTFAIGCLALTGRIWAQASILGAGLYGQAGFQRTGSANDGFLGVGVDAAVNGSLKFCGEFNFAPSASGTAMAVTNPATGATTYTASGKAGIWDLHAGLKGSLAKKGNYRFYGVATVGLYRLLTGSATAVTGPQGFSQASGGPETGAVVTVGAGIVFGSGRVKIGPEVRYLRYSGGFSANAARIGIVIDFR